VWLCEGQRANDVEVDVDVERVFAWLLLLLEIDG